MEPGRCLLPNRTTDHVIHELAYPSYPVGRLVFPPATPLAPPADMAGFDGSPGGMGNLKEVGGGAGAGTGIGSSSYSLAK